MTVIAYLSGLVRVAQGSVITLVVNGIGFLVHVPSSYSLSMGSAAELEIYTHVTQEQGMQLFGFQSSDERIVFKLIIGCSGLGPKIALALLSNLTPSLFISAIMTGDSRALSSVEGIGAKKAESMIMQLKDKVAKLVLTGEPKQESRAMLTLKQLSDVLSSLGYSRLEITRALQYLQENGLLGQASFDELLRKALALLAKK